MLYIILNNDGKQKQTRKGNKMKKINRKEIMTRAHRIRKEAASVFGCFTHEILFSECLKMAWAEAKNQSQFVSVKFWALSGKRFKNAVAKVKSLELLEFNPSKKAWEGEVNNTEKAHIEWIMEEYVECCDGKYSIA